MVYDNATSRSLYFWRKFNSFIGLAFSSTGRHLISYGCYDGRIRKWDILSGINTKTAFNSLSKIDYKIHVPIETSENTLASEHEVVFVPSKVSSILKMN